MLTYIAIFTICLQGLCADIYSEGEFISKKDCLQWSLDKLYGLRKDVYVKSMGCVEKKDV